jgi:hypothetical protein
MNRQAVAAMRDRQSGRLSPAGHRVRWRKTGRTAWHGTRGSRGGQLRCDEYGTRWLSAGSPGLLRPMGASVIRRCPGRR